MALGLPTCLTLPTRACRALDLRQDTRVRGMLPQWDTRVGSTLLHMRVLQGGGGALAVPARLDPPRTRMTSALFMVAHVCGKHVATAGHMCEKYVPAHTCVTSGGVWGEEPSGH